MQLSVRSSRKPWENREGRVRGGRGSWGLGRKTKKDMGASGAK